jgi:hypothetical protein
MEKSYTDDWQLTAPAPKLNIGANKQKAEYAVQAVSVKKSVGQKNPVTLAVISTAPVLTMAPTAIGPKTIVPKILGAGGELASGMSGASAMAPSLIQFASSMAGMMKVIYGNRVVGQMTMAVTQTLLEGLFTRLGQKLDSRVRVMVDTQKGEGVGRRVGVRGEGGAHADKGEVYEPYEEDEWWEFWKWDWFGFGAA